MDADTPSGTIEPQSLHAVLERLADGFALEELNPQAIEQVWTYTLDFFGDDRVVEIVLSIPVDRMPSTQMHNLRKIAKHFSGVDVFQDLSAPVSDNGDRPTEPQATGGGDGRNGNRGRGRGRGGRGGRRGKGKGRESSGNGNADGKEDSKQAGRGHPMHRLVRLLSLQVPDLVSVYFDGIEEDWPSITGETSRCDEVAQTFLEDMPLSNKVAAQTQLGDVVRAGFEYMEALEDRGLLDNVRRSFGMLMFYDLVKHTNEDSTVMRIGYRMEESAKTILKQAFHNSPDRLADAEVKLDRWSKCGRRLNQLCSTFGHGCVFVLAEYLSENFCVKYRETGEVHDQMFAHLDQLGLRHLAAERRMNEVGMAIRNLLRDSIVAAAAAIQQ